MEKFLRLGRGGGTELTTCGLKDCGVGSVAAGGRRGMGGGRRCDKLIEEELGYKGEENKLAVSGLVLSASMNEPESPLLPAPLLDGTSSL